MLIGAILLVGMSSADESELPVECLEVFGRSVLQRTLQRLIWGTITECAVLVSARHASTVARQVASLGPHIKNAVRIHVVEVQDEQVHDVAAGFAAKGIEGVCVFGLGAYAELDPEDVSYFFQASGRDAVGIIDTQGDLDICFAKSQALADGSIDLTQLTEQEFDRSYLYCGYVCRVKSIRDLRKFVVDGFHGRCEARPDGVETRPGVWIADGAQIHRHARIVAPAYIGRHATIGAATLITRCSSVECNSHINDHTALEDSSVLEDTYVGPGLDVMHSIIHGKHLAHLTRKVALDIEDDTLIGTNQVSALRRMLRRYRDGKANELVQSYQARTAHNLEHPIGKA